MARYILKKPARIIIEHSQWCKNRVYRGLQGEQGSNLIQMPQRIITASFWPSFSEIISHAFIFYLRATWQDLSDARETWNKITLRTLLQRAWMLLLQKYYSECLWARSVVFHSSWQVFPELSSHDYLSRKAWKTHELKTVPTCLNMFKSNIDNILRVDTEEKYL